MNIKAFLEEFEVVLSVRDRAFRDLKVGVLHHIKLFRPEVDFELVELVVNVEHVLVQGLVLEISEKGGGYEFFTIGLY